WQANSERMPEPGTRVELLIRRAGDGAPAAEVTPAMRTAPAMGAATAAPAIPAGRAP
ncbi:MAG: hypothetical protein RL254_287, partial [Planctomycetota bacterium]